MVKDIHNIVSQDFDALNRMVVDQLHSRVPLVENIGHYIVEAGGKRIRPVLVLLCAGACGYRRQRHIDLATVIEFLHTATLLHDDVVDMSDMRRGRPTANVRWDNPSSVLVGDFIYSRAFQLLVGLQNIEIMDVMATTTNMISEGEVQQLVNQRNPDTSEPAYMEVIRNKTAILFAAACKTAGILSGVSADVCAQLDQYGLEVGLAFQLVDDALDYSGSLQDMGKNVGDDLAEGKPTLPLIHTMQHGTPEQQELIRQAITNGGLENLEAIVAAVQSSGGLEYTRQRAEYYAGQAITRLGCLPESPFKQGLIMVADAAINRSG